MKSENVIMDKILKKLINSDVYRHYGSFKRPFFWKLHNPSLHFQIIYRKAHFYNCTKPNMFLGLFYRYKLNRLSHKYHIQIPYTANIGFGLNIVHYGRLIVSPVVKIGDNCNIFTGVTIGSTTRGEKKGVPTIGNCVWIGPNAVLVGNIKIGDNVLIAANSYVNFDVPSNSIVIGNPSIIKSKLDATDSYICSIFLDKNE